MSYFIQSEITDPITDDPQPCYPPSLQLADAPPPELFDQEWDNDADVNEFELPEDQIEALFSTRSTNPDITSKIYTLSAFTDSTVSTYGVTASQYSFDVTSSELGYLPSDLATHGSVNSELQASPEFTNPLPCIPFLNTAEVDLNPADDCPTIMQQLDSVTCVDPAILSQVVRVTSESEATDAQMAPKRYKCPYPRCHKSSARKYNLQTHFATHFKGAPKRFGCCMCPRGFDRKHDLKRHLKKIHKIQVSSLSAPSIISRRVDMTPDLPQSHRTTAFGREEQLPVVSSPQPDSFSNAGLEELTAHWGHATWLQGA